jgi:hypothetical protein
LQDNPVTLSDFAPDYRTEQLNVIFADHFVRRSTQIARTSGIHHHVTTLEIFYKDRVGTSFHDALQQREIPLYLLFGTLAVTDIAADAQQSNHVAIRFTIRRLGREVGAGNASCGSGFFVCLRLALCTTCRSRSMMVANGRIRAFGIVLQNIVAVRPENVHRL